MSGKNIGKSRVFWRRRCSKSRLISRLVDKFPMQADREIFPAPGYCRHLTKDSAPLIAPSIGGPFLPTSAMGVGEDEAPCTPTSIGTGAILRLWQKPLDYGDD